jgi:hypothetical protein
MKNINKEFYRKPARMTKAVSDLSPRLFHGLDLFFGVVKEMNIKIDDW